MVAPTRRPVADDWNGPSPRPKGHENAVAWEAAVGGGDSKGVMVERPLCRLVRVVAFAFCALVGLLTLLVRPAAIDRDALDYDDGAGDPYVVVARAGGAAQAEEERLGPDGAVARWLRGLGLARYAAKARFL
eukprot:gene29461-12302_t